MRHVYLRHPVKQFSGSREPLTQLLARAMDELLVEGAADVDTYLIASAHPEELANTTAAELVEAGEQHLVARGLEGRVVYAANPSVYVKSAHLGASATGAALFHDAVRRVVSGKSRRVAAIGIEQMKQTDRETTTRSLRSLIHEREKAVGLTMPALGALLERGLERDFPGLSYALEDITFTNRRLAEANPRAHIRKRFNRAEAQSDHNPVISDPLRLWNVAPTSSGYAAIVLSDEPGNDAVHVQVAGIGSGLDRVAISQREALRTSRATRHAMEELASGYGRSPIEIANRLSYAEIHDAFPIIEFLGLIDVGLMGSRDPIECVVGGDFAPGGRIPVNLSGGVMGGHPLGATGIGQIVELYLQAVGRAETQIPWSYPHTSLAFNVGGALTHNFVTLLAASHDPREVGPFCISDRPPYRKEELDLTFEPVEIDALGAEILSHTRLEVTAPGFDAPWPIALVTAGGRCEFACANGKPLVCGTRTPLRRDETGRLLLSLAD